MTTSGKFTQRIFAEGRQAIRRGTYELSEDNLTMTDELGTKDGPYHLAIDIGSKTLQLSMSQIGVNTGANLILESEYRKSEEEKKNAKAKPR